MHNFAIVDPEIVKINGPFGKYFWFENFFRKFLKWLRASGCGWVKFRRTDKGTHFNTCVNGKKFLHHLDCHLKFNNFFFKSRREVKSKSSSFFLFSRASQTQSSNQKCSWTKKRRKKKWFFVIFWDSPLNLWTIITYYSRESFCL